MRNVNRFHFLWKVTPVTQDCTITDVASNSCWFLFIPSFPNNLKNRRLQEMKQAGRRNICLFIYYFCLLYLINGSFLYLESTNIILDHKCKGAPVSMLSTAKLTLFDVTQISYRGVVIIPYHNFSLWSAYFFKCVGKCVMFLFKKSKSKLIYRFIQSLKRSSRLLHYKFVIYFKQ